MRGHGRAQHALSRLKCNAPENGGIKFNVCSFEYSCLIVTLLGNQLSKALCLFDSFENRSTGHCTANPSPQHYIGLPKID